MLFQEMGIELPCTAFRVFVTVVAALFQELGVYCHAIIAMRCISSVCDCYSRNMDINCHCHALAFGVCDCCDYRKWTLTAMHTMPRPEFRENSFVTKDCCILGNRHRLPCHAVHLDRIRLTMNSEFVNVYLELLLFG